jgi:PBP1b-binding outer membrane lipoprotein LpoB
MIRLIALIALAASLGGCVVAPAPYYGYAPAPAYGYYAAPAVNVGVGFGGGWGGGWHR